MALMMVHQSVFPMVLKTVSLADAKSGVGLAFLVDRLRASTSARQTVSSSVVGMDFALVVLIRQH